WRVPSPRVSWTRGTDRQAPGSVASSTRIRVFGLPGPRRAPAPLPHPHHGGDVAMDVLYERCAGIDIGKADVKVCVRTPQGKRRHSEIRTFSTMTNDLLTMRDWLLEEQVTLVGMEATGIYWKPVFYLLENDIEC